MKPIVVAGMAFGDEGKGTMVDYLCRLYKAPLVVRYSGGPQAGHNVVLPDGTHQCFSQFGSGTMAGAMTYLSQYMLIEPYALRREADELYGKASGGVWNLLMHRHIVHPECLVITPWHWLINRIRETVRSERHGSCGMGVGEAHVDRLAGHKSVYARELRDIDASALMEIKDRKIAEAEAIVLPDWPEVQAFLTKMKKEDPKEVATYYHNSYELMSVRELNLKYEQKHHTLIFEGAQGFLIDALHGFAPYNSWTDCTFNNVQRLIGDDFEKIGVFRTYFTRHGPGPFPSEQKNWNIAKCDHNTNNTWQGALRVGLFDIDLAQKAIHELKGIDGLAITHCDQYPAAQFQYVRHGKIQSSAFSTQSFAKELEYLLEVPVKYKSYGPTWEGKVKSEPY